MEILGHEVIGGVQVNAKDGVDMRRLLKDNYLHSN